MPLGAWSPRLAGLFLSQAGLYYGLDRVLTPKLGRLGILASGWFHIRSAVGPAPLPSIPSPS